MNGLVNRHKLDYCLNVTSDGNFVIYSDRLGERDLHKAQRTAWRQRVSEVDD